MMSPEKKMAWMGRGMLAWAALCFVPVSFPVWAAGLGKLSVSSSLGQPLVAEIDLVSLQPGEFESLTARVASPDSYRDAKIEYGSALRLLRFTVDKRPNGQPILKISSIAPVNEPFVDVLVELNWPSGRLLREYPILLDPPGFNQAQVTAPAVTRVAPASTPAATAVIAPSTSTPDGNATPSDTYGPVKKGDTLNKIATQVKPDSVSLEQMLVALYRENKGAFIGSNMNRLKAGQILRVPSASDVAGVKQGEARKEIKVQVANWKAYREGLASSAAASPARNDVPNQTTGKIATAQPDKPTPSAESKDVLKLSKVDGAPGKPGSIGSKGAAATQDQVNALKEEAVARENALKEANARVANLEKQIQDMRKLMELKGIAPVAKPDDKSKPIETAKPAADTKVAQVTPPAPPVQPVKPADVKPADVPKPVDVKPADAPKVDVAPPDVAKPADPPKPVEAVKPADQKPEPKAAPAKAPPKSTEPDLMDTVMENLPYIAGGLGALGLLGFLSYTLANRRKNKESSGPYTRSSSILPSDLKPNTTTGKAGGGLIDTGNSSFLTDFDKAGPGTIDTDEVDPVAEAEVYIAYGRDAQAEEILKEAMGRDKSRHEITLKLLEIYHSRKSVSAFESLAKDFKQNVGETHPLWAKAAAMGKQIDAANPLYSGYGQDFASTASMAATAAAMHDDAKPAPPDLDFDLGAPKTGDHGVDISLDSTTPTTSTGDMDFDLDLADPVATPPAGRTAAAKTEGLDFDLGIDQPAVGSKTSNAGGFDFDLSSLSDDKPAASADKAHVKTGAINLDDISLDLDAPAVSSGSYEEDGSGVSTKLELAKAYVEIGDKDGAREILQEVLREGTAAQQKEAQSVIASL